MSFYNNTPEPVAAEPSVPANSTASVLYGADPLYAGDIAAPDAVKQDRAADTSRSLYSPQATFNKAIPDDALPGADIPAMREVAADLGAQPNDAEQFVALAKSAATVSDDDRATWRIESEKLNISKQDLDRARALVARDPRLFEALDRSGLGNHPKVVARVVELARAAAIKGRRK